MSIFKAYDIRGIYPSEINEELAYRLGRAFVTFLGCKKVIIGKDCRLSTDKLFDALARGITDQGADVIDIGLCSSPMLYFASANHGDAGIMITASHNPKEYNGFKLCRENAVPVSGDSGMKDIENLVLKNKFTEAKKGNLSRKDVLDEYTRHLLKYKGSIHNLKVAVDTANAMAGVTIPKLLEHINCTVIPLFFKLDGTFPNHEANPLKHETLKDLQETVIKEKADLGVAFDGDGDRCGFVDEKGDIISCDLITALIAEYLLEKKSGQKILFDVRSSRIVSETVSKKGGTPVVWKIGHSLIKEKMKKEKITFAGEISGHYYFKDGYYAESEGIPLLIIMNIICEKKKPLSELILPFKRYFSSGEINLKVKDKDLVLKKIEEKYEGAEISKLDGISIKYPDWWFNLRKSNTEPLIRLNLEAKTKDIMEKRRDEVLELIEKTSLPK